MEWNLADIWEEAAASADSGERPAQIHGGRVYTWADFDRRAGALATDLVAAGVSHQGKVATFLYNGPEYLETYFAAFKVAAAPVNVNYRYGPGELKYILDNCDAEAVVFHASFAASLETIRDQLPLVRRWYVVGGPAPEWAVPYDEVVATSPVAGGPAATSGRRRRSGDDLLLLYTGGTTGLPKGVMWRQDDLVRVLGGGGNPFAGLGPAEGMGELRGRIRSGAAAWKCLPSCPLMHGTGQFSAFIAMILGGAVVTLEDHHFDPEAVWSAVERHGVQSVAIVGDVFVRPLLDALDAEPGRWELSSLRLINSSGVMWSQEVKDALSRHLPSVMLYDSLGSSEAVGMGGSVAGAGSSARTASFALGTGARVVGPDDRDVVPGSGQVGVIALPGFIPLGYYKDPEKSARTFRTIDGTRYTIPGDFASVDADGSVRLLGRGSVVINTGGEKVYPEEVEEVIKRLPGVADAVCVGVPDQRFGERVCALVERAGDGGGVDASDVTKAVHDQLAGYKVPRHVFFLETIGRSPAGKVDYPGLRQRAAGLVGGD